MSLLLFLKCFTIFKMLVEIKMMFRREQAMNGF